MDKRFTIFMIVAVAIVVANQVIFTLVFPPAPVAQAPPNAKAKPPADKAAADKAAADKAQSDASKAAGASAEPAAEARPAAAPLPADQAVAAPQPNAEAPPAIAPRRGTLGSGKAGSDYRMLVTWNNRGAAIERVELNSPRYHNLENRSGHLGYLAPADAPGNTGALVRVVGTGTPAAVAGLQVDDVITQLGDKKIRSAADLLEALAQTEPDQHASITLRRAGAEQQIDALLDRHPLAVIEAEADSQPVEIVNAENHDPLSFLLTIGQFDDRTAGDGSEELAGVNLQTSEWEVEAATEDLVVFRKTIPQLGLQVVKKYRLEKIPADQASDPNYPAYGFQLDVSLANISDAKHGVAYRLQGPTGLPIEGAWYANKISRSWSAAGLRDIIARFEGGNATQVSCPQISDPNFKLTWVNKPLDYIAVDAQYFAAALIPQKPDPSDVWFAEVRPIRAGEIAKDKRLTDVSFRLESTVQDLAPHGEPTTHSFKIFVGPKRPPLLDHYGPPGTKVTLDDLVYYGWFYFVARPMLAILHTFHYLVGNYGLAIIMLTVLVRGCMFPLSRKQAASAAKMQELQPEIKRLNEKYKNEPEKKTKAQQQLFRDHSYNPLGGCLLALVQLPIFVGLYSSLKVDVELRQASLFGENIRWASNLAAPDMFWNWSHVVPEFVSHGTGFLGLGPYLNILPLVT
ncbi:MAG TPA: YidC/Oxa1 family insertase periplasmic-domain containing protein, partial [Pirellulales bacterium]|nr:YidC/Oxa1 family insertase periplasmic-domain containing protein [Pirellulales bacterium]